MGKKLILALVGAIFIISGQSCATVDLNNPADVAYIEQNIQSGVSVISYNYLHEYSNYQEAKRIKNVAENFLNIKGDRKKVYEGIKQSISELNSKNDFNLKTFGEAVVNEIDFHLRGKRLEQYDWVLQAAAKGIYNASEHYLHDQRKK